MRATRVLAGAVIAFALGGGAWLHAQTPLPIAPQRQGGQSVTPAFEGWYRNPDGSYTLLVGYFNRNRTQTLDIPIGPNNRIEPGGHDMGQPTHFLLQKQWGVFAIRVPADFAARKLTWTIVSGGETNSIPFSLHKNYTIEPFKDAASGNLPPTVRFQPSGPVLTGPPVGIAAEYRTTVVQPLSITYWIADDMHAEEGSPRKPAPASSTVSKFRGPGDVIFAEVKPPADHKDGGKSTLTARFSAPGEYILRVQVNDSSGDGGGGFQCCWTNAHVKVTVTP